MVNMYNHEQKSAFITQYTAVQSVRRTCVSLFNAIAPYEESAGKDVCCMDVADLGVVVQQLVGLRSGTNWNISILRRYLSWCVENQISGARYLIDQIKLVNVEHMMLRTVTGPRQLQIFLNALFKPESEQEIDNLYRAYFWLAYAGMPYDDYLSTTIDQVDLKSMSIEYKHRLLPIYREALPCFVNCVELPYFKRMNPKAHRIANYGRYESDLLFRGIKTNPTHSTISRAVKSARKDAIDSGRTSKELNYTGVFYSGIFYRMYEDEVAGLPIDAPAVANLIMNDKEYSNNRQERNRIASELRRDYAVWKLTIK